MHTRKFLTYNTLYERLKKLPFIHNGGKHTTFLLNVFVYGNGQIYSNNVISNNLLKEGETFKEWIYNLITHNIINHEVTNLNDTKRSKYTPGYKIVDLIEKERKYKKGLLIMPDKNPNQLGANDRMLKLESMNKKHFHLIQHFISLLDPPFSDEKYRRYMESPEVMQKNLNLFIENIQKESGYQDEYSYAFDEYLNEIDLISQEEENIL